MEGVVKINEVVGETSLLLSLKKVCNRDGERE
jgi:hypothetical protein